MTERTARYPLCSVAGHVPPNGLNVGCLCALINADKVFGETWQVCTGNGVRELTAEVMTRMDLLCPFEVFASGTVRGSRVGDSAEKYYF